MNKAQLKKIESLRKKKEAAALAEHQKAEAKRLAKERYHATPLSEWDEQYLARPMTSDMLAHALCKLQERGGAYIPRVLTSFLYSQGLLSTGETSFALGCPSAFKGMSEPCAWRHAGVYSKAERFRKSLYKE